MIFVNTETIYYCRAVQYHSRYYTKKDTSKKVAFVDVNQNNDSVDDESVTSDRGTVITDKKSSGNKNCYKSGDTGNEVEFTNKHKGGQSTDRDKIKNEKKALLNLCRLVNNNFTAGNMFITLTYKHENEPADNDSMQRQIDDFLRAVRKKLKAIGVILKNIYVVARSEFGELHLHMIINSPRDFPESIICENWKNGYVGIRHLNSCGDYTGLAVYLFMNTEDEKSRVIKKRWCSSSNLEKPEKITHSIKPVSIYETPTAEPGYYLQQDSLTYGVANVSGIDLPYQMYKLVKLGEYGEFTLRNTLNECFE